MKDGKGKGKTMTTAINVTVTPAGGHGQNLDCTITGDEPYVVDNAIFLPINSGDFDINFNIDPASNLSWDTNGFCASVGKCPRHPAPSPGTQQGQFKAAAPKGKSMTVTANAQSHRSVAHYRLDFSGGNSFDPIIINM